MAQRNVKRKKPAKKTKSAFVLPAELFKLEKIVGQFMEYWGFKNVHGRIWTHLFTSQVPLDSIELMARLGVSKGLMSIAIRDLLEYEVIKSDHTGRHGTTFYLANPDLLGVITNVLRKRESTMLTEAFETVESIQNLKAAELERAGISAEKMKQIANLTESAQALLGAFLAQVPNEQNGAIFAPLVKQS